MIHKNKKAFFSIIELLVVLSILAILASLMFPALKRSAEYANVLLCKNTMRQFSIADELYAENNNEAYVIINSNPWQYSWFINSEYLSYFDTSYKSLRLDPELKCPNFSEPSYFSFSYAPNWSNKKFGWYGFPNKYLLRSRTGQSSQKIKMIENTDWHAYKYQANPNRWQTNGEQWSNTVTYRHMEQCNILFVDGHIELRSFYEVYYNGDYSKINQLWEFHGDEFSSN